MTAARDYGWFRVVIGLLAAFSMAFAAIFLVIPGLILAALRRLARPFRRCHETEASR